MTTGPLDEEWELLARFLPQDWRELARETGAMRRARGAISTPDTLLQVLLLHVATGLSLRQAVARARVQGLASLTDVALLKRLRSSADWLKELSRRMFAASRFSSPDLGLPAGYRLRAVDATTVEEPGATGTDWRVHYCIALPEMSCDFFELTDVRGTEGYQRLPVERGDIVLADRGYCHREGVAHVLRHGGDVVVRLHSTAFPLLTLDDEPLALLPLLRALRDHAPGEWPARFQSAAGPRPVRVCAVRKSEAAAAKSIKKLLRNASKKGTTPRPETLEFARYVLVLTSLDAATFDAASVLELYRARWQVELCFKRLKSLLHLGHLPKRNDDSAQAWIQGKLLTVLLTERLVDEAAFFSPWGFPLPTPQSLA
jgi:hypothetical protein